MKLREFYLLRGRLFRLIPESDILNGVRVPCLSLLTEIVRDGVSGKLQLRLVPLEK